MSTKGPGKLTWSAVLNLVSYRPNLVPGWGLFHYLRNRPRSTGELHFHILEYLKSTLGTFSQNEISGMILYS